MTKRRFSIVKIVGIIILMAIVIVVAFIQVKRIQKDSEIASDLNKSEEMEMTSEDFLQVEGNRILNQRNEEIILQGVNLGGWLIQEYWMCPIQGDPNIVQWTNLETLNVLEKRFTEEQVQELIDTYQDNWITEWDIKNIADHGLTVIRVPFWYRNFMLDAEGTWIDENFDENPGFQRLDWVIEMAEKYGLYIILDMHGCPGGQTTDHVCGSARRCELFEREEYQDAMEKLWVAIAERYQNNPAVAAYDIMNEPQVYEGDVNSDPRNLLYDRMIKAIRKVDDRHIITVEGIWSLYCLPKPEESGWTNIIYQTHAYDIHDAEQYCREVREYSETYKIPVYVGEFYDLDIMEQCQQYDMHYTSWSYKGTNVEEGTWFWYQKSNPIELFLGSADVLKDPYLVIKAKWGYALRTENFAEVETVLDHVDP